MKNYIAAEEGQNQKMNENGSRASIWSETTETEERIPLSGNKEVDVAVIGAGMAGILTAFFLQQRGRQVIVLEADRLGGGQTKNTTAKITSQHGLIYEKLIRKYGLTKARLYAKANEEAIRKYQNIIEENDIDCDFERLPSYLYSIRNREKLIQEAKAASRLGLPATYMETIPLPFSTAGAVCFENQAQFHPLKFLKEIEKNLEIYENTMVYSVKGHRIMTNQGTVEAEHIVFATHYPFPIVPGFYFLRQHQERSYVVAFSGVRKLEGMYYSIDEQGLSLRRAGDLILLGSGTHRTGKNESGGRYAAIRAQAKKYFPEGKEAAHWSAQDCKSHDQLPLIGVYSHFRPYWYVATGFKKWGMTFSMISAMIISDRICGTENPYEKLFSPQRFHPLVAARDFMIDFGTSIRGLLTGYHICSCMKEKNLEKGHGGIVRKGFRRYASYRDETGTIHRISLRCPHMGCELLWNPDELSWDCPCHGSRFDYDGNLIDNPAQKDKMEILE